MRSADPSAARSPQRAIFVYYKVAREHVTQLQAAFQQAAPIPCPALPSLRAVQLMRRTQDPGSPAAEPEALQTWMEIYWLDDTPQVSEESPVASVARENVESLRLIIEGRARAAGILDHVEGPRHYEAFESCA
ncbi:MAG TPA: DUF4936 family protein [Lautropia sp.]|jgi:hypothetical protein|nr:DUF4936 family protein [Lautropia sp.]